MLTSPKTNSAWWEAKLAANRARDEATDRELRTAGWEVIRVWQHEDVDAAAARIHATVLGLREIGPAKFKSESRVDHRIDNSSSKGRWSEPSDGRTRPFPSTPRSRQ